MGNHHCRSKLLSKFSPIVPKTVQNLDEEPFTGNSLLYPHGQPTIPQSKITFDNPKDSICRAQKFIKKSKIFGKHGCAICPLIYYFGTNGFDLESI